jgi:hypothetical protein
MNRWLRNKGTAEWSVYRVCGHLFMTTSTFVALVTFSWVISFLFDYLSAIHKFQHDISEMVEKLEIGVFYLDFRIVRTDSGESYDSNVLWQLGG